MIPWLTVDYDYAIMFSLPLVLMLAAVIDWKVSGPAVFAGSLPLGSATPPTIAL